MSFHRRWGLTKLAALKLVQLEVKKATTAHIRKSLRVNKQVLFLHTCVRGLQIEMYEVMQFEWKDSWSQ